MNNEETGPAAPVAGVRRAGVDLGGLMSVLSRHLYSTPMVALRELVQNAHDSIVRRRIEQPDWTGPSRIDIVGDRATVTLKGASASVLAQWLAQARSNAHAAPLEARLAQSADAARAAPAGEARWNGTLVLSLPAPADKPSDKGRAP